MGAVTKSQIAVRQIEDPGIFAVKPTGIFRTKGNDFLDVFRAEILRRVGMNSINAPDSGSWLLVTGKLFRILGVFLGRNEKFDALFHEVKGHTFDGDDIQAVVSQICFRKGFDFFKFAADVRGAEDG